MLRRSFINARLPTRHWALVAALTAVAAAGAGCVDSSVPAETGQASSNACGLAGTRDPHALGPVVHLVHSYDENTREADIDLRIELVADSVSARSMVLELTALSSSTDPDLWKPVGLFARLGDSAVDVGFAASHGPVSVEHRESPAAVRGALDTLFPAAGDKVTTGYRSPNGSLLVERFGAQYDQVHVFLAAGDAEAGIRINMSGHEDARIPLAWQDSDASALVSYWIDDMKGTGVAVDGVGPGPRVIRDGHIAVAGQPAGRESLLGLAFYPEAVVEDVPQADQPASVTYPDGSVENMSGTDIWAGVLTQEGTYDFRIEAAADLWRGGWPVLFGAQFPHVSVPECG